MNMRLRYIVVLLVTMSSCGSIQHKLQNSSNVVVAHRGAWKQEHLPENSIASLKKAIKLKCAGAEFDVRMTLDSVLVVNHDEHYQGMLIEDTKYEELASIKLSNGEQLPTLKAYLLAGIKNNKTTGLVCEIKPSKQKERGIFIAQSVVDLVTALNATSYVSFYISFDYDILKKIAAISTTKTQYLYGDKSPDEIKNDGISGLDYYTSVYKNHPEWIPRAKKLGLILNAWTANKEEDLKWLLNNNFDYITTDEPELLLKMSSNLK